MNYFDYTVASLISSETRRKTYKYMEETENKRVIISRNQFPKTKAH